MVTASGLELTNSASRSGSGNRTLSGDSMTEGAADFVATLAVDRELRAALASSCFGSESSRSFLSTHLEIKSIILASTSLDFPFVVAEAFEVREALVACETAERVVWPERVLRRLSFGTGLPDCGLTVASGTVPGVSVVSTLIASFDSLRLAAFIAATVKASGRLSSPAPHGQVLPQVVFWAYLDMAQGMWGGIRWNHRA
mmetsp:Transcript_44693/g.83459  ORF Transcript_44693/g.83459 Transcript_44693/m.83459 type:complete len:200 (+) Transcript_44693:681-1280(+)